MALQQPRLLRLLHHLNKHSVDQHSRERGKAWVHIAAVMPDQAGGRTSALRTISHKEKVGSRRQGEALSVEKIELLCLGGRVEI